MLQAGIFTRAHIGLIAERGPEANIPLSKPGGFSASSAVHASITINGPTADQGNLTVIPGEHAREIARQASPRFSGER
jgi:hypothetical protein